MQKMKQHGTGQYAIRGDVLATLVGRIDNDARTNDMIVSLYNMHCLQYYQRDASTPASQTTARWININSIQAGRPELTRTVAQVGHKP